MAPGWEGSVCKGPWLSGQCHWASRGQNDRSSGVKHWAWCGEIVGWAQVKAHRLELPANSVLPSALESGLVWQFAVMATDVMFWNFQARPYEASGLTEHCPWEPRVAL